MSKRSLLITGITGIILVVIFCVYLSGVLFGFIDNKMLYNFVNKEFNFSSYMLPIEKVRVEAPFIYTNEEQVKSVLMAEGIQTANFFNINMNKIIRDLEKNPWVKDVQLTREWPDSISIKYNENLPLGYLNQNKIIIKDNCEVVVLHDDMIKKLANYSYEHLNKEQILPFLVGDEKNTKKLCDTLEKIEIYVKPINNRIKKLVFTKRNSVYMELDNGLIVLLGKSNTLERVKLFVSFISNRGSESQMVGKDAKIDYSYIDMRYHNGLAVGSAKEINLTELMETA